MNIDRAKLQPVEIHHAGVLDCPGCGHEMFVHTVTRSRKPGVANTAQTPDLVTFPDVVRCDVCGTYLSNEESHPK